MLESMKNIEIYYQELSEEKSYQALQAVPYILDLIGMNFKKNSNSFWLTFGTFLRLINEIYNSKIQKLSKAEIDQMFIFLAKNVSLTVLEGVKDRSFFEALPDDSTNISYVALLASIMGDKMKIFIYEYLSNSSQSLQNFIVADFILSIVFKQSCDFIYSLVASEIFLKAIEENITNVKKLYLVSLVAFIIKNRLIGKTEILILKSILNLS